MNCVMAILDRKENWEESKKYLTFRNYLKLAQEADCENVSEKKLKKVEKYLKTKNYNVEHIKLSIGPTGAEFCQWSKDWYEAANAANMIPK